MNPIDADPVNLIDADPLDYYEEYSEWLIRRFDCCNGKQMLEYFEDATDFEIFLTERSDGIRA